MFSAVPVSGNAVLGEHGFETDSGRTWRPHRERDLRDARDAQEWPQIDSEGGIGRFHGRFAGAILSDSMGSMGVRTAAGNYAGTWWELRGN